MDAYLKCLDVSQNSGRIVLDWYTLTLIYADFVADSELSRILMAPKIV
jgi:hypothetical protein